MMSALWKIMFRLTRRVLLFFGVFSVKVVPEEQIGRTLTLIRPFRIDVPLVRVGPNTDGGYLLPDDFDDLAAVFSPGVADVADFEKFFLDRGVPCYLIDPTVNGPPIDHQRLRFEKLWLGAETVPGKSVSLTDWVAQYSPAGDLVLQMDIEGHEYEALLATPQSVIKRFRHIVIEFHSFDSIASKSGSRLVAATLGKILSSHVPVHAHPNNCDPPFKVRGLGVPRVVEVTFTRRDGVSHRSEYADLPHHLDFANTPANDWSIGWPEN